MEKLIKKYPLLGSSADSEKLSLTIKSLVSALIPVVVIALRGKVSEKELIDIVSAVWAAISAVGLLIGLVRKVYLKLR